MPISDEPLWKVIRDWPLPYRADSDCAAEPPRPCKSFEDNLRMRGEWTDESAQRITATYRQFLYLKALTGGSVTPSDWIDQAWHLHLSFPDNYAALCRAVGRDLRHDTDLSQADRWLAYDRGRDLYEAEFDSSPARDLWPSSDNLIRAERLILVRIGAILLLVFGMAAGVGVGGLPGFAVSLAVGMLGFFVLVVFDWLWGGTKPEMMARCG